MQFDPKIAFIWGLVTTALRSLFCDGPPPFIDPHISEIVKQGATWFAAFTASVTTYVAGFRPTRADLSKVISADRIRWLIEAFRTVLLAWRKVKPVLMRLAGKQGGGDVMQAISIDNLKAAQAFLNTDPAPRPF